MFQAKLGGDFARNAPSAIVEQVLLRLLRPQTRFRFLTLLKARADEQRVAGEVRRLETALLHL